MSIYVYITRHRNPLDDGPAIEEQEWLSATTADPAFREPADSERESPPRRKHTIERIWTGHPEGFTVPFSWTDGQIDISNADEPMIAKAMQLARTLNANVVSEMGEIYNDDGSHKGFVDGEPW